MNSEIEQKAPLGDPDVLRKLDVGSRRTTRRWVMRIVAALVLVGLGVGAWLLRERYAKPKPERWVTAPVQRGDLRETVTATGTLSPLDSVQVGAEVTGRVLKVHVDVNDVVKQGQVLVELDTEQLQARVEESSAQLQSALASQRNAGATIKEAEAKALRAREMHKRGLVSDQDLETAEAALDRAKATVSSSSAQIVVAQAGLKSTKTTLGKAIIRSPMDGIVLARTVEVGQTVTAGFQTPVLLTLARDLKEMQLKIDIDEADVGKVNENQVATFVVDAYPKRTFRSKLVRLGNLPKTGTTVVTYEATLTVDNADRLLRPGMTATATIVTTEKKDVMTLPNAALRFQPPSKNASAGSRSTLPLPGFGPGFRPGGGGPRPAGSGTGTSKREPRERVWVVRSGELASLSVEVGSTDGRRTEVRSNELKPGTEVVVDVAEAE